VPTLVLLAPGFSLSTVEKGTETPRRFGVRQQAALFAGWLAGRVSICGRFESEAASKLAGSERQQAAPLQSSSRVFMHRVETAVGFDIDSPKNFSLMVAVGQRRRVLESWKLCS